MSTFLPPCEGGTEGGVRRALNLPRPLLRKEGSCLMLTTCELSKQKARRISPTGRIVSAPSFQLSTVGLASVNAPMLRNFL